MELQKLINEQMKKSKKLQEISFISGLSYDKSKEIREEQDKLYKKYLFLKGLNKALEEKEKMEIMTYEVEK